MDRDIWMKEMGIFSSTCGASKLNPQVLFFDYHDSQLDDRSTHLLRYHYISPFILNAEDSNNDQPNDNGTNLNIKRYHGLAKLK